MLGERLGDVVPRSAALEDEVMQARREPERRVPRVVYDLVDERLVGELAPETLVERRAAAGRRLGLVEEDLAPLRRLQPTAARARPWPARRSWRTPPDR
jgi:hypothetical protein